MKDVTKVNGVVPNVITKQPCSLFSAIAIDVHQTFQQKPIILFVNLTFACFE